jgi:GNAT superfamily N-acetyltransferase
MKLTDMKKPEIRLATLADASAIHELHTASVRALCKDVYSAEVIDGWLRNRSPTGYKGIGKKEMYVAETNESIVGFSHVVPGEIVAIFVHPKHVRQGIASALVRHAIVKARTTLGGKIKIDSTLNAEQFYKTMGFIKTGERIAKRNDVDIPIVEMELKETQQANP